MRCAPPPPLFSSGLETNYGRVYSELRSVQTVLCFKHNTASKEKVANIDHNLKREIPKINNKRIVSSIRK
jgi:hypothetical protein